MSRFSQQSSVEHIERTALEVFAQRGFEETTVNEIAAAAGISRRSFFRYFPSKNDIPFGNFPVLLAELEEWLACVSDERLIFEVIAEAVLRFNRVHSDGPAAHRERMKLIMHTPALRANAALRNADYLNVLARYAARRMGEPVGSFRPQLVGHVSHGVSVAAYEEWLQDESADLAELVRRGFAMLEELAELAQKGAGDGPSHKRASVDNGSGRPPRRRAARSPRP
jgi:TetR/AcrR family transcriptional regulator, regulator of mycofactocin system